MNFPAKLNPLKGTRFGWLVPLTWQLIEAAARTAPTTVEVFFHHRFGVRYGASFLKGFILLLVVSHCSRYGDPPPIVPLFPTYLFAYTLAAIFHWIMSHLVGPNDPIYSYSWGDPWPFWRRVPVSITVVRRLFEPVLCCLLASLIAMLDRPLARWLVLAAIALFVKEHLWHAQLRTRRLNALDNRIESDRLAPRPRMENETFVEAREAPPRRAPNQRMPGPRTPRR
jgi:hypothetical protein